MFKRLFAAALVFGAAALAPPISLAGQTQSQYGRSICGPRTTLVRKLIDRFGETRRGAGLVDARRALEIWASDRTGSWTVIMTRSDGIACVVASGKHWHSTRPALAGDGV